MPFIEMPLGDVREEAPVPQGKYSLKIVKAEEQISKSAKEEGADQPNMLHVVAAIQSDEFPNASTVQAWFMYPDGGEWDQLRMRELRRFLYWFNVAFDDNGFNTDDVEGAEADDIPLIQDTLNNGRTVNVWSLDPVPEEDGGQAAPAEEEGEPEPEGEPEGEDTGEAEPEPEEEPEEEPEPAPAPRRAPARKPAPAAKAPARKAPARSAPRRR